MAKLLHAQSTERRESQDGKAGRLIVAACGRWVREASVDYDSVDCPECIRRLPWEQTPDGRRELQQMERRWAERIAECGLRLTVRLATPGRYHVYSDEERLLSLHPLDFQEVNLFLSAYHAGVIAGRYGEE